MNRKPLRMGKIEAKLPVIQGGMGVDISLGGLAGAVAKEGGIGIISAAQIGFREPDFDRNPREANLRAVKTEYDKARSLAPEGARVGRLGGDEFGVLLATERKGEAFLEYAQRLVEQVRQIRWQGTDVLARCSIGVAALRPREGSWMKLYNCADRALYMAKQDGRDCVRFYQAGEEV